MAAAAGLFGATGLGLLAVLFTLMGLRALRHRFLHHLTQDKESIEMTYVRGHGTLGPVIAAVEAGGGRLESLRIDDDDPGRRRVALDIRAGDRDRLREHVSALADLPEVEELIYG
jgi:hypothetical protein